MAKLILATSISWIGSSNGRGGRVMHVLHWLHGLRSLGHDVLFYDTLSADDERLRDDERAGALAAWFGDIVTRWWDPRRAACVVPTGQTLFGLSVEEIERFAQEAEGVIALGAFFTPPPWLESVRPRILIDSDPGLTQFWAEEFGIAEVIGEQELYFTLGPNIGHGALVPTLGLDWRPIRSPVVLDWWRGGHQLGRDRFTTVGSFWEGEYREIGGKWWGPKGEQLNQFMRLPELAGEEVELAAEEVAESPELVAELRRHGWRVEHSGEVVNTVDAYRDYIQGSAGEFSCAKGVVVGTQCGWFSERSACYLAAGRPVVVQDTGIGDHLPTGVGLFAVNDVDEAAEAIRAIRADYPRHSATARRIAADHFAAERALRPLVDAIGVAPRA